MKIQKTYQEEDQMISLIRDNYDLLQSLGSFGIPLGFGDKTVREVCEQERVDTYTFLTMWTMPTAYRCPLSSSTLGQAMSITSISSSPPYAVRWKARSTWATDWPGSS